jgi:hypothetical protein
MAIGVTTFQKKCSSSGEWERIGHIEWTSPLSGTIQLGDEEVLHSMASVVVILLTSSRLI